MLLLNMKVLSVLETSKGTRISKMIWEKWLPLSYVVQAPALPYRVHMMRDFITAHGD